MILPENMSGEQTHDILHYLIESALAAFLIWRTATSKRRYRRAARNEIDASLSETGTDDF